MRNGITREECIEWPGAFHKSGYGRGKIKGKHVYVHRFVWESHKGKVPDDLFVLHKCDNPPCFNLDHLYVGTHQDNMIDMSNAGRAYQQGRTHCKFGHLLDGIVTRNTNGRAKRFCRTCYNARARTRYWNAK